MGGVRAEAGRGRDGVGVGKSSQQVLNWPPLKAVNYLA